MTQVDGPITLTAIRVDFCPFQARKKKTLDPFEVCTYTNTLSHFYIHLYLYTECVCVCVGGSRGRALTERRGGSILALVCTGAAVVGGRRRGHLDAGRDGAKVLFLGTDYKRPDEREVVSLLLFLFNPPVFAAFFFSLNLRFLAKERTRLFVIVVFDRAKSCKQ